MERAVQRRQILITEILDLGQGRPSYSLSGQCSHRHKGGALPLHTRHVLIAGGLVDLRLVAEFCRDLPQRHAAGNLAAVPTVLADVFIDDGKFRWFRYLATLLLPAALVGAF